MKTTVWISFALGFVGAWATAMFYGWPRPWACALAWACASAKAHRLARGMTLPEMGK